MNKISERLRKIAESIIAGRDMADIGSDHAALPIFCIARNLVPHVFITDVRPGPLGRAEENVSASGLEISRFSFLLGNGLNPLRGLEVGTAVIAGMGGELIASIIENEPEIASGIERFVLQPRSRAGELRIRLWKTGYRIDSEHLVSEGGRICEILRVSAGFQEPYEDPDIPQTDDPLMSEFLDKRIFDINNIIVNLKNSQSEDARELLKTMNLKLLSLECLRKNL